MIEFARPNIEAVMPDPHVNARLSEVFILWFAKISINSFLLLKVPSNLFINSPKGKFLEPGMFPLLKFFLISFCFPKNLSLERASIKSNNLVLILESISSLFITNYEFSFAL